MLTIAGGIILVPFIIGGAIIVLGIFGGLIYAVLAPIVFVCRLYEKYPLHFWGIVFVISVFWIVIHNIIY